MNQWPQQDRALHLIRSVISSFDRLLAGLKSTSSLDSPVYTALRAFTIDKNSCAHSNPLFHVDRPRSSKSSHVSKHTLIKPYLRRPQTGRTRGRSGPGSWPTSPTSTTAAAAKDLDIWWWRHPNAEYIKLMNAYITPSSCGWRASYSATHLVDSLANGIPQLLGGAGGRRGPCPRSTSIPANSWSRGAFTCVVIWSAVDAVESFVSIDLTRLAHRVSMQSQRIPPHRPCCLRGRASCRGKSRCT